VIGIITISGWFGIVAVWVDVLETIKIILAGHICFVDGLSTVSPEEGFAWAIDGATGKATAGCVGGAAFSLGG